MGLGSRAVSSDSVIAMPPGWVVAGQHGERARPVQPVSAVCHLECARYSFRLRIVPRLFPRRIPLPSIAGNCRQLKPLLFPLFLGTGMALARHYRPLIDVVRSPPRLTSAKAGGPREPGACWRRTPDCYSL